MNHRKPLSATLLAGLLLILVAAPLRADVLTLNNGDELFGKVLSATPDRVELELGGKIRILTATEVLKLEFETLRMPPGEDKVETIKDPLVQKAILKVPTAEEYPEANLVDILDEDRFDLASDGTWTHEVHRIFVALKESGREAANKSFPYFPDLETFDLDYGRAITPGKAGLLGLVGGSPGTVRYVSDHTIADETDFASLPLFQRRHTVKFAIPEVGLGTIVEWKYRVRRNKLDPMLPFYAEKLLRGREPRQVSRLVIRAPAEKKILYKVEEHGIPVHLETKDEAGFRIYTFEARDVPAVIAEANLPGLARIAPRVACAPADEWKAVAAAYDADLRGMQEEALRLPALTTLVERETKALTDPFAKAARLFTWLGKEITHVPVDPQAFTYRPHSPAVVLEKKQANLIDLGFLYHVLLTKAGVEHHLGLVRTLGDGELVAEVPCLQQADALVVEIPGATGAFSLALPVGDSVGPDVRLSFLQGASGVRLPDGSPLAVPFCPPEDEGEFTKGEGKILPDGTLEMQHVFRARGNTQASVRGFKNQSRDEIRVMLENILHQQFPGARLQDFSFENLEDVNQPLVMTYRFTVPDFALKSGDDLLVIPVPVDPESYSARTVGAPRRLSDLAWPRYAREEMSLRLELPPGFTLHALPDGLAEGSNGMWYASSFGFTPGVITFHDTLVRERDRLSPAEYPGYKRLIETRSEISNQWIVIRKTP